jgi:hypothetical protein
MYIFAKTHKAGDTYDNYDLVLSVDSGASLPDLLENFKYFLLGCGYAFRGDIVIEYAENADVS